MHRPASPLMDGGPEGGQLAECRLAVGAACLVGPGSNLVAVGYDSQEILLLLDHTVSDPTAGQSRCIL